MREVRQPGPPAAERIQWVEARGRSFCFVAQAGLPLLEAVRQGFAAQGFVSGVASFKSGALGPFAYVMPALSKTPEHAAFYSDTYRPQGITRLSTATMTLGTRDGTPFFHCHALWTEQGGRDNGGHILPEETIVAEPFEVEAFGLDGALFAAEPDPETNFKLFGPVAAPEQRRDPLSCLRAAAATEPGFCGLPGGLLPGSWRQPGAHSRRCRLDHRCALQRWPHHRAVRNRTHDHGR